MIGYQGETSGYRGSSSTTESQPKGAFTLGVKDFSIKSPNTELVNQILSSS